MQATVVNQSESWAGSTAINGRGQRPRLTITRDHYRPSLAYALRACTGLFGPLLLLIVLLPRVYPAPGLVGVVFVALGVYAYKLTILLHDCAHGTLFASPATNRLVGIVSAALLGSSFDGYKTTHWEHHRHCGTSRDNFDGAYLPSPDATRTQIAWHLMKPLFGLSLLSALVAGRRSESPLPRPADASRHRFDKSLLWVLMFQAAIAVIATDGGRIPVLAVAYPLAAGTLGLFLSRLRTFCEHEGMAATAGDCFARSHEPNAIDRLFFYTLNFNYHVEHHLYPQIPSHQLPAVHEALVRSSYFDAATRSTSIVETIAARLAAAR